MIDVLSQPCPNCQAPVGEACTAADNYSRHPVKRVHGARIQAVHDAEYLATDAVAPEPTRTSAEQQDLYERWKGEPVADMSEEFQRDAEIQDEAERRYPDVPELRLGITLALRQAFMQGAEWGSRPF